MGADDAPWRHAAAADPPARMPIALSAHDTRPAPTRNPAWTGQRGPCRAVRAARGRPSASPGAADNHLLPLPARPMLPARFAGLADPQAVIALGVLRAMECRRMAMHAFDYQRLSLSLREAMGSLRLDDLLFIARKGDPLLAELAENLLYDVGAETLIDKGLSSRHAVRLTRELMHRMAMDPNAA